MSPDGGAPGVVVHQTRRGIDAIDQYSRRLTDALTAGGSPARYVPDGLGAVVAGGTQPAWVLLQYQPFAWGRYGFAPGLLRDARELRRRWRVPFVVMVHEAWMPMSDVRTTAMGIWQRAQLRGLLRLADGVMASTEALARELGGRAVHVPVGATVEPTGVVPGVAREHFGVDGELTVTLFGRGHPTRALDHAEAAIAALAAAHRPDRLIAMNLGAGAPTLRVPHGVRIISPGLASEAELSLALLASDLVLLPFSDGVSTRRTTLMAALAHGRPVLGLHGRSTDAVLAAATNAIALTPAGDKDAFSSAAVELAGDPERRQAMGEAAERLYEARFGWSVIARQVAGTLETVRRSSPADVGRPVAAEPAAPPTAPGAGPRPKPREVVFVIHDLGGPGGMELHAEQLVNGLLDAGVRVTVVARTCRMAPREGLSFVRVRAPSRPFVVAYPAFFAIASPLTARRRTAIVHATGAIISGRVDVSTVHYCHRAETVSPRASRRRLLYRANAEAAAIMSRLAEDWCYRPARTRLLCPVSRGVEGELRRAFPDMAGSLRTVPNGVDMSVFSPDRDARRAVRAELAIGDDVPLALFVGGDWQRKGVSHAVDALEHAPGWHLAVAGPGDPEPLLVRARAAGTTERLRFLGPVREMPRLYAAADAFVLPTSYETFSLVTFEAAATALPLLVARVNGVEDVLVDGGNGWFIEPDGMDIARRLNELRADPELARALGAAAREAASGFTWEKMIEGYRAAYAEVVATRH